MAEWFDDVSRALATPLPRRKAIATITSVVAAAAAGLLQLRIVRAEDDPLCPNGTTRCPTNFKCCGNGCCPGGFACCSNGGCCPPGLTCVTGGGCI